MMPDPRPHALIFGASSGIGAALALRLAGSHTVTALARRMDRLDALAAGNAAIHPGVCDVAMAETIQPAIEAAVAARGPIDLMVYCAGLQSIRPLRTTKRDEIDRVITVNLTAAVQVASHFASPRMTTGDALFCIISSIAAQRPEPGIIPYAVAKAGVEALVKGVAREAAPRRAVAIAPGWLDTEMTQGQPRVYTPEFRDKLAGSTPRGIATVDQVVDLIMFLARPESGAITGQTITIDGGASL